MIRARVIQIGWTMVLGVAGLTSMARAGVPYVPNCYYVPQTGSTASPTEGAGAIVFFRSCPNNDALPNHARIKIVIRDVSGTPIPGIAEADVGILLNGGTPVQGFTGNGADSVLSNSQNNPTCPDVRLVQADAPTDSTGTTYITFIGANASAPGVGARDPGRKWGHYDTELPVYVLGFKLAGRLTSNSGNGSYTLRIKNFDWTGGTGTGTMAMGEAVTQSGDINGVANGIGINNTISYWKDFDSSGSVTVTDLNLITVHNGHNCTAPNNP